MSDENEHEHEHHFQFPFLLGPTPEQIEHARMNHDMNAHETRQFFDGLTVEQLKKLSGLFSMCYASDGDAAQYFSGIITGFLDQKFNLCLACGKNHDEELNNFAPQRPSVVPYVDPSNGRRACCQTTEGKAHKADCDYLIEFNLEPDDGDSEHVQCKGCGKWYVSVEDRMVKTPGIHGCDGCIEKNKWG